ncbi:TPA: hypothetical protein N0F65_004643, partial [Lagenidium giganteum]
PDVSRWCLRANGAMQEPTWTSGGLAVHARDCAWALSHVRGSLVMAVTVRTARKVHRDDFLKTIKEIRKEYLKRHQRGEDDEAMEENEASGRHVKVCVRKRPMLPHELTKNDFDVISTLNTRELVIHECKMYPDMRHKFIVSHHQKFSRFYDERAETEEVYVDTTKELVLHAMRGGKAVCMMYGQTGSGKTYTMGGLFQHISEDIFTEPVGDVDFSVHVSAVEIAGSKCFDHRPVQVCDDGDGNVSILNLSEEAADSANELHSILENVKELRTTESTAVNSQSSRSHLVCYINLRPRTRASKRSAADSKAALYGQLVLLDLAGSERNEDTFYHDAARTKEAIEINKSHLALKQCMRALGSEDCSGYVPYRASTLTRILKGCLWSKDCRGAVIATISPLSVDTEHTLYSLQCAGEMLADKPMISSQQVDVREGDECPIVALKDWDNRMVTEWFCALRKGEFKKYASNLGPSVDGRLFVRFSLARLTQICNGNAADAGHIYKALRNEMASLDKQLKERRARNMARNQKTSTARIVHGNDFRRAMAQICADFWARPEIVRGQPQKETLKPSGGHTAVYVRKRPVLPHEAERDDYDVVSVLSDEDLLVHDCRMYPTMKHKYINTIHQRFTQCFDENATTCDVYADVARPLVHHAIAGGHVVCMMYGQTGSGKTFTMGGLVECAAGDVFLRGGDASHIVSVHLLNNHVPVTVCEDSDGKVSLLRSTEIVATNSDELLLAFQRVQSIRMTESTAVNDQSSRSHLVCYLNIDRKKIENDSQLAKSQGQLVFLDLAGSERNENTLHHDSARLRETVEINKSHLALKQCMWALENDECKGGYVPYRASTLTRILKGCLWSTDCLGAVIATISPLSVDTEHTLCTLQCAGEMLATSPLVGTEKVNVNDEEERSLVAVKDWDNAMIVRWLSTVQNGQYERYTSIIRSAITGRLLLRFSVSRFTQICDGNRDDANAIFKALREEIASQETMLRMKRIATAAQYAKNYL